MNEETKIGGRDVADLLPWYANGRLTGRERQRVSVALASDPALQRELTLIVDEQQATIELNESLGAPSRQAVDRFFAALERKAPAGRARFDLSAWVAARAQGWRSRAVGWGALAAAVVVVAQAGVIGALLSERPTTYAVSSVDPAGGLRGGAAVFVAFEANAPASAIDRMLEEAGASIVQGPLAGGIYEIRIGDRALTKAEIDDLVARFKARNTLIRFVAPKTAPD